MNLPESQRINVAALSAVFADTTNSYKFYWLLAILDGLQERGSHRMSMRDLSLRMLASVWYPLDYFKLSFGRRDGFKPIADFVSQHLTVDNRSGAPSLFEQLKALPPTEQLMLERLVKQLTNWVPYRFIRPMFALETRGLHDHKVNATVTKLANSSDRAPYRFEGEDIILHESWVHYLQQHQVILRGYTNWHLVRFIQKNNPNVTGLTEKLEKPGARDFKAANQFWKQYLAEHDGLTCIYSGQTVTPANLSLDHFLPWSFVAHDQIWNIVPTSKAVNSAKNNWLPSLERYFEPYASLQFDAFSFHTKQGHYKLLEDYHVLFAQNLDTIRQMPFAEFRDQLQRQVFPQLQTAQNIGFAYPFIYDTVSMKSDRSRKR